SMPLPPSCSLPRGCGSRVPRRRGERASRHSQPTNDTVMPLIDRHSAGVRLALAAMIVLSLGAIGLRQMRDPAAIAESITGGDSARAPKLITRYGCGGCHTVAGVPGADGHVGPALERLLERVY